jgi:hypothetical protein
VTTLRDDAAHARARLDFVAVVVEDDGPLVDGPPVCASPLATTLVPPKPVSEEPMESVITRLGSSSTSFSLMLGENSAAVLASRNSEDKS